MELNNEEISKYIHDKYKIDEHSVCLGVRRGSDFSHMTKLKASSYQNAINCIKKLNPNCKFFIISDSPTFDFFKEISELFIEVNESDIVQMYLGIACNFYILSESSFHLWIAYLGTTIVNKTVVCFNNTDITNRNLNMEDWITIDY